ncbi:double zinc ribbon domain-containing protein [Paraburkholderia flava]|uniref:double zinc ribbon domain-containing protein n=1 Tax=Paraburkholderia flava TaxID=2547393 RepID=UPI001061555A
MGFWERMLSGGHGGGQWGGHGNRGGHGGGHGGGKHRDDWGRGEYRRPVPEGGGGVACPSCRAVAASGTSFCAQCGSALAPATCSGCGNALTGGVKFCGQCGKAAA